MLSEILKERKSRIVVILVLLLICGSAFCFLKAWHLKPAPLAGIVLCDYKTERWLKDGAFLKNEFLSRNFKVELSFCADSAEQTAVVERLIAKGAEVLVIAANDTTVLSGVLEKAAKSGCRVISYDRLIQNSSNIDFYVTFDSAEVGRRMTDFVISSFKPTPEKPIRILLVGGAFNDSNTGFLHSGVMSVLAPLIATKAVIVPYSTNLTTVALSEWSSVHAKKRVDRLIAEYGVPDALICYSDRIADGAIQALDGKVKGKYPLITGQDASRTGLRNIQEGKQGMTVLKDSRLLAEKTAKIASLLVKNAEIGETATVENGAGKVRVLYSPIQTVTKQNIPSEAM